MLMDKNYTFCETLKLATGNQTNVVKNLTNNKSCGKLPIHLHHRHLTLLIFTCVLSIVVNGEIELKYSCNLN